METETTREIGQERIIDYVLESLFYEDKLPNDLTHNALKLLHESKSAMKMADTLLIGGIVQYDKVDDAFRFLSEAEQKGCHHPILYHYLADCYRDGNRGVAQDASTVLEYTAMAISGGYMPSFINIFNLYAFGCIGIMANKVKAFNCLLDLEREGYADGGLLHKIGHCYMHGDVCDRSSIKALAYFQRAATFAYAHAYLSMYELWAFDGVNFSCNKNKATLILLEAERKGLNDDRILNYLIYDLRHFNEAPSAKILGRFPDRYAMALHYCDVLILRKSSYGYSLKGDIYWSGDTEIPKDEAKAVSIWNEADRHGFADHHIYCGINSGLSYAHREGIGVPQNGSKVLEYCEKALRLAMNRQDMSTTYRYMATVYERGIPPIEKQQGKVDELKRKAEHFKGR